MRYFNYSVSIMLLLFSVASAADDGMGLKAFGKTLYPRLRQSCISCHGDGGQSVGHSVADMAKAYSVAKNYVEFDSLEKSAFSKVVRNKHWLKYDENQKGMEGDEMVALLQAWWTEGEFAAGSRYDYVSAPIALPENLPLMQEHKYAELEWNLGETDARLIGCKAKTKIQRAQFSTEKIRGSYRVRDFKFICVKNNLSLNGIYFFVTDQSAVFENLYQNLGVQVIAGAQEVSVITEPMILIQREAADSLKIVFEKIAN